MATHNIRPLGYEIYGLRVQTSEPLCGVPTSNSVGSPDLVVQFATGSTPEPQVSGSWQRTAALSRSRDQRRITVHQAGSALRIVYDTRNLGRVISVINAKADHVWLQFPDGLKPQDMTSLFLGAVLGGVLRRRGQVCLHASAAAIDGRAILLVGQRGTGKSTSIAALLKHAGANLVADDIAVLQDVNGIPHVLPGYPAVRLNSDAVAQLCDREPEDLPRVFGETEKRYAHLGPDGSLPGGFAVSPVPIAEIVVLVSGEGNGLAVSGIPKSHALLTLIENSYGGHTLVSADQISQEFTALGCLLDAVPLRRIRRHYGLAQLPSLCAEIVKGLKF